VNETDAARAEQSTEPEERAGVERGAHRDGLDGNADGARLGKKGTRRLTREQNVTPVGQ
jgi:hypothetical protein